jgi:hypothetical protein
MSLRVLVQAGHLAPREPGISGLGAAGEVELNTAIRDALARAEYVGLCRHFGLQPTAGGDDRHPTLRKGMTPNRKAVTRLQHLLRAAHVADTPLNGKYDVATRLAVKRFQRKHNITPDLATVQERTWKALEAAKGPR